MSNFIPHIDLGYLQKIVTRFIPDVHTSHENAEGFLLDLYLGEVDMIELLLIKHNQAVTHFKTNVEALDRRPLKGKAALYDRVTRFKKAQTLCAQGQELEQAVRRNTEQHLFFLLTMGQAYFELKGRLDDPSLLLEDRLNGLLESYAGVTLQELEEHLKTGAPVVTMVYNPLKNGLVPETDAQDTRLLITQQHVGEQVRTLEAFVNQERQALRNSTQNTPLNRQLSFKGISILPTLWSREESTGLIRHIGMALARITALAKKHPDLVSDHLYLTLESPLTLLARDSTGSNDKDIRYSAYLAQRDAGIQSPASLSRSLRQQRLRRG